MTLAYSMPLIIRALGRGKKGSRDLSREEATYAMHCILDGSITPAQLGAMLMLLRVKEETCDELAGMVDACHQFYQVPKTSTSVDVNWPAYAGKKRQPSWYILSAMLLAQNGVQILMHGGGEHTPDRQYAETVCRAFNIPIAQSVQHAEQYFMDHNLVYLPLRFFSPQLSGLIDLKHELGLRSPVNTLVRHIEPLKSQVTLQAMFHPAYMPLHHGTAIRLNQNNNIVVKGDSGEFEVRPDTETAVQFSGAQPTKLPKSLTLRSTRPERPSVERLISVWQGSATDQYGIHAIIDTAALVYGQLNQLDFVVSQSIVKAMWNDHLSR